METIDLYCDNYEICSEKICSCYGGRPWSAYKSIVSRYNLLEGGKLKCSPESNKETTFSTSPFLVIIKRKLDGK